MINHKPVFQRLMLDQGFYPECVWMAPSDAALKRDIELSKEVGIEPPTESPNDRVIEIVV